MTRQHDDDKKRLRQRYEYRWLVLASGLLAYAISHLIRWNYASIATSLARDLRVDQHGLGVLSASFFYAYALAQTPWGMLTDRYGGRITVAAGSLLMAACLFGFSTSASFTEAVIWRTVIGGLSAAFYVPVAGIMAHWFTARERGLSHTAYAGLGGGLGEAMTFLLLPVVNAMLAGQHAILGYEGWRGATVLVALIAFVIGIICWVVLRSRPEEMGLPALDTLAQLHDPRTVTTGLPPEVPVRTILKDPMLWLFSLLFSGFIIALRLVPGWLPVYISDLSMERMGRSATQAIAVGGTLGALYVAGRSFGTPLAGKLSDALLAKGISRVMGMTAGVFIAALLFLLLTLDLPSIAPLVVVSILMGVTINLFPLMNAAVVEVWGMRATGTALGVINTVAQLVGASTVAISGLFGVQLGDWTSAALVQYRGIWYLGLVGCAGAGLAGVACERRRQRRYPDVQEAGQVQAEKREGQIDAVDDRVVDDA
ncbi:MAG: MFS transporter, partial [Candidatus Latescibacteria bacterium]|nr:MFS transporter [Candidatus Latescibacterota bacterium]